jgi:hypothetical protein
LGLRFRFFVFLDFDALGPEERKSDLSWSEEEEEEEEDRAIPHGGDF